MKKIITGISLLGNGVLLACLLWFLGAQSTQKTTNYSADFQLDKPSSHHTGASKYSIAIVTPVSHPALEEIERGFKEVLIKEYGLDCDFTTYNANGSRTLIRSQFEDILQKNYDAMFTIGAMATQMAKEVTAKRKILMPIIFGAVADPIRLGLIKSLDCSGNNLTGATAATKYATQIDFLLQLKKDVKTVLIVYDPTQSSGLENDKKNVVKLLEDRNIRVKAVEVYHTHEIHQKIEALIADVDVVMIFKDNTVVPAVDSLVKLCNKHKVTLVTSDLDSVRKGAAIGFGVREYEFGAASAFSMAILLREKKQPSEIPAFMVDKYRFVINTKTMESQGLIIEKPLLALLKSVERI